MTAEEALAQAQHLEPRAAASLLDAAYGLFPCHELLRRRRSELLDSLAETHFGIVFRFVPSGKFWMGSETGDPDERPVHEVTTEEFWLAETPLSWANFGRLMGSQAGRPYPQGPNSEVSLQYCEDETTRAVDWHSHIPKAQYQEAYGSPPRRSMSDYRYQKKPMVGLAATDAESLCQRLTHAERGFCLPTEAQWEKAARGGLVGQPYPWGSDLPGPGNCDFRRFEEFSILPSRTFPPNGYGLYAMCGGVWEWTSSGYDSLSYSQPEPPDSYPCAVIRGGSWSDCAEAVTVSFRSHYPAARSCSANIGCRLCMVDLAGARGRESDATRSDSLDEVVKLSWQLSGAPRRGAEGTCMIVMVQLTAAERPGRVRAPLNVSLVLDRSGSMEGVKLNHCKHAARYALSQLTARDLASVVAFDNTIDLIVPHVPVRDKHTLMPLIRAIVASGGTNLSGGWLHGATKVEKSARPGEITRVVLLTDGRPNDGATHPDSLVSIARDLRERGVQTTTVGVGADVDEDLLRAMAEAGGGNFHFIESPEETSTLFAREFVELLTIVAQNLVLRVIPAAGVKVVRFLQDLAFESVADGQEVPLGDLLAGDQRSVLVEFLIPPGHSAGAVSGLQLEYQQVVEPIGSRRQSASVEAAADSVVNPAVWREVLLAQVCRDLRQARQEADSGHLELARRRLGQTRKTLEECEYSSDPSFVEQCHELETILDLLSSQDRYDRIGRKMLSVHESSSAGQKSYTRGGVLAPWIRKTLAGADSVLFLSARDLAGLPDATLETFEGLNYAQLTAPIESIEQAARQWRWIVWRQQRTQLQDAPLHRLLLSFQHRWPTTGIVTTATDGLHVGFPNVVELFGSLWRGRCQECQQVYELQVQAEVPVGSCGHPLRPDIVWPGEQIPRDQRAQAMAVIQGATAVVVLGEACQHPLLVEMIARRDLLHLALTPGPRPAWADGHIPQDVESALRTFARETSTSLP